MADASRGASQADGPAEEGGADAGGNVQAAVPRKRLRRMKKRADSVSDIGSVGSGGAAGEAAAAPSAGVALVEDDD